MCGLPAYAWICVGACFYAFVPWWWVCIHWCSNSLPNINLPKCVSVLFLYAVTNSLRYCSEVVCWKLALAHRLMLGYQPAPLPPTVQGCSIPMSQPEQWVEPVAVWLVWLGGKWKPLSRFFSLPNPNAKHRREVIWIAKAALAVDSLDQRLGFFACWFCFVLSCVLKWASLLTVTLSVG